MRQPRGGRGGRCELGIQIAYIAVILPWGEGVFFVAQVESNNCVFFRRGSTVFCKSRLKDDLHFVAQRCSEEESVETLGSSFCI